MPYSPIFLPPNSKPLKEAELAKRLDFDRRRYRAAGGSIAA
jgi:hypothetical protein